MSTINLTPESHIAALRLNVAALHDARWHLRNFLFALPLAIALFSATEDAIGVGLIISAGVAWVLHRILVVLGETHDDLAERVRELSPAEIDALSTDVPALRDQLARWRRIRPLTVLDRTALLERFAP